MKKTRGFTLIELLAVIAILAIIALIAIPIIDDLVKETKMKAFSNSAHGIIKAGENYYARKAILNDNFVETTFEFPNNVSELKLSGKLPESGTMTIDKNGNIALAISDGKHCATKTFEETEVTVTKDLENCTLPYIPKTFGQLTTTEHECTAKGAKCTPGETLFTIKVNGIQTYNFYVINDDGNKVTLIMDRNLGDEVAWVSATDYNDDANYGGNGNNNKGPITALEYLNSQTVNWINIEPIENYTYNNNLNGALIHNGYQWLKIVNGGGTLKSEDGKTITTIDGISRARLLTYEEATQDLGCTQTSGSCPFWLRCEDSFWTLTAGVLPNNAWLVGVTTPSNGLLRENITIGNMMFGVRPVIELSK